MKALVVIGPASIHTYRYLFGVAPYFKRVFLISSANLPIEYSPENLSGELVVDFSLYSFKTTSLIRQFLIETKPDAVHIHQVNSTAFHAYRALRGLNIPSILTAWGSDILVSPNKSRLLKFLVKYCLRRATLITVDSLQMASEIRGLIGESANIEVVNFGVDAAIFKKKLIKKSKTIISTRLHKRLYRVDRVIEAFAQLKKNSQLPGWNLVIAATGEETPALMALVDWHGLKECINFVGFVNQAELHSLYCDSSIYISIPNSDGTSISLLEAMASGCIPVVSNLPSNLEWIIDEINGFVVEDVRKLSQSILKAVAVIDDESKLANILDINENIILKKGVYLANMKIYSDNLNRVCVD